jgi:hypothetical protein
MFVLGVFAINIGQTAHVFHMDLSPVQHVYSGDQGTEIYEVMDVLNPSTPAKPMHYLTQDDLVNWKYLSFYFLYIYSKLYYLV